MVLCRGPTNPRGLREIRGCTTRLQVPGASDCYVCVRYFSRHVTQIGERNQSCDGVATKARAPRTLHDLPSVKKHAFSHHRLDDGHDQNQMVVEVIVLLRYTSLHITLQALVLATQLLGSTFVTVGLVSVPTPGLVRKNLVDSDSAVCYTPHTHKLCNSFCNTLPQPRAAEIS